MIKSYTVEIYSLEEFLTEWGYEGDAGLFSQVSSKHTWGDCYLSVITGDDVRQAFIGANIPVPEALEDGTLFDLDWNL